MSTATAPKLMTAEEFLALPDDGVERWLCRGELRERRPTPAELLMNGDENTPEPYLIRGEWRFRPVRSCHPDIVRHAMAVANHLDTWHGTLPEPRYEVLGPPVSFQLRAFPPTLACFPLAVVRGRDHRDEGNWVPGVPLVVVEVFAGEDRYGDQSERIEEYLECGVAVVWSLTPSSRTMTVHRFGQPVDALDVRKTLTGDPELPDFTCPVAEFFR